MTINRRNFTTALGATAVGTLAGATPWSRASAQAAVDTLARRALDAGEREVVVAGGTGAYGELVKTHFYDPFTAATGIKVTATGGTYGEKLARLKAMTSINRMEWDVVSLSVDTLTPETTALLTDLGDCAALPNVGTAGVPGSCVRHGVLFDVGGGVLLYSRDAFPDGRPQPANWADFWNVRAFPGPRALPNIGTPWWSMMAALIADGVAPDKLFPLDVDRAFRKLDEIKPHVTVWWRSGDQSQQIFRSREVVMAMMFAGRALRLVSEGLPLNVVWNGAPLDAAFWGVTRGAPHQAAARALLNFIYTRPDAHAAFIKASFGATAHREAVALLAPAEQRLQAVHPDNWSKIVPVDRDWLAANQAATLTRWAAWIAS
ncbi:MAG: ABC transporter substrate-binding protein [Alphaproteobacteria bacterium]|nr:ABC transporter substrate-binding protein [Alphaproteobacteria bacterium]